MKMTASTREFKAYNIGVFEAREQKKIVPACKSERLNAMMKETPNDVLPLINAYNEGIAYEINRQIRLGII